MIEGTAYGSTAGADAEMAELAQLADELIAEIGSARRHYDELRATLDEQAPAATEPQDEDAATAVAIAEPPEAQTEDEEPDDDADDGRPSAEGAHLVALNLALMGIDREDARIKLCDGFEIEPDTVDEILDEAFGAHERNGERSTARRRFRRRRNGSG